MSKNLRTVYTTEHGRIQPESETSSKGKPNVPAIPKDGIVRVGRETKGRKGAGVSVITGLPLPPDELKNLARELKSRCGSGGTVRGRTIEIQGDHRDRLVELLTAKGWTIKRAGG